MDAFERLKHTDALFCSSTLPVAARIDCDRCLEQADR